MKTISIANAKGGVGKTTLSVNLAYELFGKGYKVAMIDLDSQCDLSKVYQPLEYAGPNIVDVLQKECRVTEAMIPVQENLHLIPGSKEIMQLNFSGSEQALLRVTKSLKSQGADFVVIDHPPTLHDAALAGYVASDFVLIVSEAEAFSVQNLGQLIEDLTVIKEVFQPNLQILGIVMNKIDRRRSLTQYTLQECKAAFGDSMLSTMISNDTAVPNSLNQCIPVRHLHWRSKTVSQFSKLASEMIERMGVINEHG